jgi:hypothetical protein
MKRWLDKRITKSEGEGGTIPKQQRLEVEDSFSDSDDIEILLD